MNVTLRTNVFKYNTVTCQISQIVCFKQVKKSTKSTVQSASHVSSKMNWVHDKSHIDLARSRIASGCSGSRCRKRQIFISWFRLQTWWFKKSKQILASAGANGFVSNGSHGRSWYFRISSSLSRPLLNLSAMASGCDGTRCRKRHTFPLSIR